jgi:hypothetical protein
MNELQFAVDMLEGTTDPGFWAGEDAAYEFGMTVGTISGVAVGCSMNYIIDEKSSNTGNKDSNSSDYYDDVTSEILDLAPKLVTGYGVGMGLSAGWQELVRHDLEPAGEVYQENISPEVGLQLRRGYRHGLAVGLVGTLGASKLRNYYSDQD